MGLDMGTIRHGKRGFDFLGGYTAEEQRELLAWPHSLELFAHFRELSGPLCEEDFAGYARALRAASSLSRPSVAGPSMRVWACRSTGS